MSCCVNRHGSDNEKEATFSASGPAIRIKNTELRLLNVTPSHNIWLVGPNVQHSVKQLVGHCPEFAVLKKTKAPPMKELRGACIVAIPPIDDVSTVMVRLFPYYGRLKCSVVQYHLACACKIDDNSGMVGVRSITRVTYWA